MSKGKAVRKCGYCCLCGVPLSTNGTIDGHSILTKDHVFPRDSFLYAGVTQKLCRRCNQLKSNNAPTAILYKLILFIRVIESKYKEFEVRDIRLDYEDGLAVYRIRAKGGIILSFREPWYDLTYSDSSHEAIEFIYRNYKYILDLSISLVRNPVIGEEITCRD